jgi:hypothetical protein
MKVLALVVVGLSVIGVSAAILSMLLGTPIGDDYGAISTYKADGNWLHEAKKSLMETGRYGQSIAASLVYGAFGDKVVTLLPIITITWFTLLTYLYTRKILESHIKNKQSLTQYSGAVAIILTFLVLFINNAPETTNLTVWVSYQTFFWPSGIITYTLPLLLLSSGFYAIFLSSLQAHITRRAQIIYFAILILISSLFNEVQPATLLIASSGLFILSYLKPYQRIKPYRHLLLTSIALPAFSLIALFFAPGRAQRSKVLETITPSSDGSLIESVGRNLTLLANELYLRPREVVLLIVIGILSAIVTHQITRNKKAYKEHANSSLLYAVTLVAICIISIIISITLIGVGYGYNAGIYVRTMLISQLLYVISLPYLTFSISSLLLSRFGTNSIFRLAAIFFGVILILSIPKYLDKILTQVNSSTTYHNAWIEQDNILRKAASNNTPETVYLKNPAAGMGDGFSLQCTGPYAKSTMWLNVQMTQYYGNQDRICPEADREADHADNEKWTNQ